MTIIGNEFLVTFEMAKAKLYFESDTLLTFTILEKEGQQVNTSETVAIQMIELRPLLYLITWKEAGGTTVSQVYDYEQQVIYSNWTTPGGEFKNFKGTIEPVSKTTITVQVAINAPIEKVWKLWTTPKDIMQWNNPSTGWHNTKVEVDLRDGGAFLFRMKAKDGSDGFDYRGKYNKIKAFELIDLITTDGRSTTNTFTGGDTSTTLTETFEPEAKTPLDLQKDFCQGVLNSFKRYVEAQTM